MVTIVTNDDVELVKQIIADPQSRGVIFNIALADFKGKIGDVESGKYATRLETVNGNETIHIEPDKELIGMFEKERKDILLWDLRLHLIRVPMSNIYVD